MIARPILSPILAGLLVGLVLGGGSPATAEPPTEIPAGDGPDTIQRVEHRVPLGDGRHLHVIETRTARAFQQTPRRAVLFLSGSVFRGNHWTIPVDGYDGGAIVARRGLFAFAVDYLGVGESTRPENGRNAAFEDNLAAIGALVDWIRETRQVPAVDLVGAGYGGAIGVELARDPERVRSVATSAMIYREVRSGPLDDPQFVAMLENDPDGYFPLPGEASLQFMEGTPEAARQYVAETQGGLYPVDAFLVATDRPFFDPAKARAPGLVLFGELDPIAVGEDIEAMAADWGGPGATYIARADAGHAPRTERPEIAAWYWETTLDFLDPPL